MNNLKAKAIKAYNEFTAEEYGNEPTKEENFKGTIGVLYSTFDAKGYEYEIDIEVSYNLDAEEYIVEVGVDTPQIFAKKTPLEAFIEDMEDCDFNCLYEYFVEKARKKFNLAYDY